MTKIWTLEEARKVLPEIIAQTRKIYATVEGIRRDLIKTIIPENEQEFLEDQADRMVQEWSDWIPMLGAEVKGLWLVDFDHGSGYYCWKYGEAQIMFEHGYEAGFDGRSPIPGVEG